jgi:predicted metalloprotease with PDZ domain
MKTRTILLHWSAALPLAAALLLLSWPGSVGAKEDDPGWLGVSLQQLTPALREAMDISSDTGVLISQVMADSPADEAGLKEGDVILSYDGKDVASTRRLTKLVRGTEPDQEVAIRVLRKGQEKTFQVKIGERDQEQPCWLGLPPLPQLWVAGGLWLGIKPVGLTDQLAEYFHVKDGRGVLVSEVVSDSPAEKAGLKAGDIIVKVDDERIEDTMELRETIGEHEEGDEVMVTAVRDGKERTFQATLEESPEKEHLALTETPEQWPQKMKKFRLRGPSENMMDFYIQKESDEEELQALQERLEAVEKELEKIQEKFEMK